MKIRKHLPLAITAFILVLWFLLKVLKFNLGFYFSDLYSHLQLSNFWLRGEDFLHENRYGDNRALHNYYLNPLLGIFTKPLGAYGLFLAHILLFAWGAWLWLKRKQTPSASNILFYALFLGPFAYWLWDNRPYGWHVELLYFPLVYILAQLLKAKRNISALLVAIAILIIREDGVLLLWATGLLFLVVQHEQDMLSKKTLVWTSICVLLFIAGIGLITHYSEGQTRLTNALIPLNQLSIQDISKNFLENMGGYFLFCLPFMLLLNFFYGAKYIAIGLLASLPLLIGAWVSGLIYLPDTYHSVLWQPRMSALWAVWLALFVFLSDQPAKISIDYSKQLTWIILLWTAQYALLIIVREHNLVQMTVDIRKEQQIQKADPRYTTAAAMAQEIPQNTYVAVPYEYFHLFHKHKLVWPDHPENSLAKPEYVIARLQDSNWNFSYTAGYDSFSRLNLIVKQIKQPN